MLKNTALLILLLFFLGCSKKSSFEYAVPAEFQDIIKRFETEAALRGKKIKINNLKIVYDESLTLPVCALSNVISSSNDVQKVIRVSRNSLCWNCDAELEAMIFHELGHCILGREHDLGLLPKGYPRSIMYPNNIQLYTSCGYPINGVVVDNYYRRSYYLDELFNPATPVPDWGK